MKTCHFFPFFFKKTPITVSKLNKAMLNTDTNNNLTQNIKYTMIYVESHALKPYFLRSKLLKKIINNY